MGKWMLLAAPLMLLGSRLFPAGGGAAALYLWTGLGLLIPEKGRYPYVRKRRLGIHRLFFACSACVFLLEGMEALLSAPAPLPFPGALLADAGAVCFSLLPVRCLLRPLPRSVAWSAGAALGLAAAWLSGGVGP